VASIETRHQTATQLGVRISDRGYEIPFFHRTYTITAESIADARGNPASHAVAVILCKYLLLCPRNPGGDETLVTYKDFRDAAPYVIGFRNTAERPIADFFSGKKDLLAERCRKLGGQPFDSEVSCDLSFRFDALPRIPLLLLFNDADEEFSAGCTILFQRNAADYLDMECLAMIGSALAAWLPKD
jgi:hypothetical protein